MHRHPIRLLLAALVMLTTSLPGVARADGPKLAADSLLALETERFRLTVANDIAALDKLLADDLTYCHSNGLCETKAQYLGNLKSGSTRYRKIELTQSQVRRHGDLAVLNGRVRIDADMGGNVMNGLQLVYTDIYRRERGRWRLIAWHSSRLP